MAENKWICPACGQENDGKFCVGCGAAAPAPAADTAAPAAEEVTEAVAEAVPAAAEAAEAAPAAEAAEAAPVVEETISVPAEPAYDTTPVEQITEPIAEPVAAEAVTPAYAPVEPAKVDPDEFVPAEPDHSGAGSYTAPAQTVSDPDNFVPAPMQPQKQTSSYGAPAAPSEPKPAGYNLALIGLILAIVGIIPCIGPLCAIAGLILAIISKNKGYEGGMGTAALVVSIISIVLSLIFSGLVIACIVNM